MCFVQVLDKGVPGQIRALLTPTKIKMKPKALRAYLRTQQIDGINISIDANLKKSLIAYQRGEKRKRNSEQLDGAESSTYGALNTMLEKMDYNYLLAQGAFNEHTTFVLGEPLVVPSTGLVTVAFSTENLLLNAYRQSHYGMPSLICVDFTHRLIAESMICRSLQNTLHMHAPALLF